jgi:hypothetical protein
MYNNAMKSSRYTSQSASAFPEWLLEHEHEVQQLGPKAREAYYEAT